MLIHAATGGVGLAALQVARRVGAVVFATAGSPEKRALPPQAWRRTRHGLALSRVRRPDHGEDRRPRRGRRPQLAHRAGPGEKLGILAPYGRFIEIGKRDIDENNALRLRPFNRNLTFSSIDIDRLIVERPRQTRELMEEIRELFRAGNPAVAGAVVLGGGGCGRLSPSGSCEAHRQGGAVAGGRGCPGQGRERGRAFAADRMPRISSREGWAASA